MKVYDPTTGGWIREMYSVEAVKRPSHNKRFGPVSPEDAGMPWIAQRSIPPGARYCEELDAYVPAELPYRIRGIKKHRRPLTKRILTRKFWSMAEDAADGVVSAIGLTHSSIRLIPLKVAQQDRVIKYRGISDLFLPTPPPPRWSSRLAPHWSQ